MNALIRILKISVVGLIMISGVCCVSFGQVATDGTAAQSTAQTTSTFAKPEAESNGRVDTFSQCVINELELDASFLAFENPLWQDLFISVVILLATLILAHPLTSLIFFVIQKIAKTTKINYLHEVFKSLRAPLVYLFYVSGLYLISYLFFHETKVGPMFHVILTEVTLIILIWGSVRFSDALMENIQIYAESRNKGYLTGFLHLIKRILRITIIILGITILLDNMGLKIGAFLTALGLGGAALAFASKDVIANFYGSVAILLDRPFNVGDPVNIAGNSGKVESIGIRSTNIRTSSNTIISIPNGIVAASIIDNQSPQPNTLVTLSLAIAASTPKELIPEVMEEFKSILKNDSDVDESTVQVVFSKIQPYSLEIEIYFGIRSKNPPFCRTVKDRLNFKLIEALKAKSITLSYF